jgi:hypothetical protein
MKIAISLSGQPYSYKECLETFNLNLYSNDSTVYSHFWWDKSYLNKCYKMHYKLKIKDEYNIKNILKNFNISCCKTEPHTKKNLSYVESINLNTWKGMSLEYHKMMVPILLYGVSSQIESINKSIKLIDKDEYDVIIRTRPDIIYSKDIKSIIKNLNFSPNTIYIQSSNSGGHLYAGEPANQPCDWFYMGSSDTMILFTEALKNLFEDKFKHGVVHLRDFIKSVANDIKINLVLIDFGAVIFKQTPLFDEQYKNKIDIYNNDFDTETASIKTPDIWPYWINNVDFKYFKKFN